MGRFTVTVENTATDTPKPDAAAAPVVDTTAKPTDAADDLLGDPKPADKPAEGKADEPKTDTPAADEGDDLLDGKVGKDGDEKQEGEKPEGEGEPVEYTLTPPEGYELDKDLADAFTPVAKELKLSQEQAQGLVEKFGPQMLAQIGEKQAKQWAEVKASWAKEFKSDPEYGGKNLDASLANVARARDYFGPEFTAAVKLLGGNNNPAILKALARMGAALGEDTPGFGAPPSPAKSREQRLYPNDPPKTA